MSVTRQGMRTEPNKSVVSGLLRGLSLLCIFSGAAVSQGSLLLVGGGSEDYGDWSDVPYRWLVNHAPNRKIVVLNYEDTTDFFSGYFPWLSPCSVTNLAVTSSAQANDSSVFRRILECDGVFLRGGDQWQYVSLWRHTLTEIAIRQVFRRGGVVGGTSAGAMILGEVVYDARLASTDPRAALRNQLGASITLTEDFLSLLPGTIIDSHFFERGRLGRLPAFLACYRQSSGREIVGIGVEYGTALAVGPDTIGEVMGSGTVTILGFLPHSQYFLESGTPLSVRNLRFDQLTAGERVNVGTWEPSPSGSAAPYSAGLFSPRGGAVFLDGSGIAGDWTGAGGSLKKFQVALAQPTDTVGIVASPANQDGSIAVASALAAWGVASRSFWIGQATMNDSSFASNLSTCGGLVFVGNQADSVGGYFDDSTAAGHALSSLVGGGRPIAFLGDDTGIAGDEGIGQMYRSIYGAYYGYLKLVQGVHVLKGVQSVSRLYEQPDYIDNRASSVFWSMARNHLPLGILLDQGAYVMISGSQIRVYGSTPVMVIDARDAAWASVPDWHDPGKANPRALGGILGARMHVVRDGELLDLSTTSSAERQPESGKMPGGFLLMQNYPNPFNPTTVVRFQVPARSGVEWPVVVRVRLTVCDVLGREVAVLTNEVLQPGSHEVTWNAAGFAGGVYFARMTAGSYTATRKLVLVR